MLGSIAGTSTDQTDKRECFALDEFPLTDMIPVPTNVRRSPVAQTDSLG